MIRDIPLHIPPIFGFSHFKLNHKLLCREILLICSRSHQMGTREEKMRIGNSFVQLLHARFFSESLMSLLAAR